LRFVFTKIRQIAFFDQHKTPHHNKRTKNFVVGRLIAIAIQAMKKTKQPSSARETRHPPYRQLQSSASAQSQNETQIGT